MLDPVSITTTFIGLGGLGAIGIMVRRVLSKQDEHASTLTLHTADIAVIKSKLPNGEWSEIKSDLAVMRRVDKLAHEDLSSGMERLHAKFDEHVDGEEHRIAIAVKESRGQV